MGTIQVRTWIGVVENIAVYMLLCITYIDNCLKGIFPIKKLVPRHSALIPVLRKGRYLSILWSILSHKSYSAGAYEHRTVPVSKTLTSPAETESSVVLANSCSGLMTTEQIRMDIMTNRMLPDRGIYEVWENIPFRILVTNFLEMACNTF